ncbi:putative DNA-directed RNA polymerase II subunit RPB7 [Paratrimastix pyriformis]|uniref:DNA-directed RNA polymerase II subunit RPB7 n=1 Tax=Paratrimastix pyriformis TaxID=342808 RepID=A0ABQ8UN72_9EUKA|nr:putative DNA-directed RNA polymerase II subunit RPB7 [Paratrimastix pyriformis]
MFFLMRLEKYLELAPEFFGPHLRKMLEKKLRDEVTSKCQRCGYVVAVHEIEEIGEGRIRPGKPTVSFRIKYTAIVMRPFKGEVLDTVVSNITKFGVMCEAGPLVIHVSSKHLPPEYDFDNQSNPPCYVNRDDGTRIQRDQHARIRVLGLLMDPNDIRCVGTMKEDYLGLVTNGVFAYHGGSFQRDMSVFNSSGGNQVDILQKYPEHTSRGLREQGEKTLMR